MKNKTKTNYLLGILLSVFMIVWIINTTNWATKTVIETNPDSSKLHTPSLFSLFLWNPSNSVEMSVATWSNNLDILNWLIVWKNHTVNWSPKLSVIWWWKNNIINASYAWIGGWQENEINKWENWAIWWWYSNKIWTSNNAKNWVIAWWRNNHDDGWWIILWWKYNKIASLNKGWVILWWQGNSAWPQSLVLWSATTQNPRAWEYSFIWNQKRTTDIDFQASINAENWMLIWTYNPITGVSLVSSWAIRLWQENNNIKWWIHNSWWCIQFYDWNVYNTLGKVSEDSGKCGINTWCQFGIATLHNWDIVTAYSVSYTGNCQNASGQVTCLNWKLVDENNQSDVFVYPYCYNLSDDPIITVTEWYQQCHEWLPDNAEWVNQYFTQELDTNTNTYNSQPEAQFDPSGAKECSYDCKSWYEHENGSCVAKCIWWDEPDSNDSNISKNTSTSQPQEWKYVNPGSELAACQWTCIGGAIREWNKCVPMDAGACSTNITFPNGLCTEGEASDVSIEIQDINNFTKSAYWTWSCWNLSCSGKIPTATFNRELSGQNLKISINKYINGSDSRTYDSVNFSGVTVWFRHNEHLKHPVIYNSISDIYTSTGDWGQYEFAGNPIRYWNKCRRRNWSEYNNCTTDSITPLFWAKDGYIMVEWNDWWTISCSTNPSFPDGLCTQGEASNLSLTIDSSDTSAKSVHWTWKCGTNSCSGYIPTATFNFEDIDDEFIDDHLLITINKNKFWNKINRDNDNINFSGAIIMTPDLYLQYTSSDKTLKKQWFGWIDISYISIIYGTTNKCRTYGWPWLIPSNCNSAQNISTFWTKDGYIMLPWDYNNHSEDVAYLLPWPDINKKMIELADKKPNNIKAFRFTERNWIDTTQVISTPDSPYPVYITYDRYNQTIYYYSDAKIIYMNQNSSSMFSGLINLENVPWLSTDLVDRNIHHTLDTSKVTDMSSMFRWCKTLTNISALSKWNTSSVTDINHIFHDCESLTNISALKNWTTNRVTNMAGVFYNCLRLTNISPLANWKNNTNNVTSMWGLFSNCQNLQDISALSNWKTDSLTDMTSMFYNTKIKNISALKNWKTNRVTSMSEMFFNCTELTDASWLSEWNTNQVANMTRMFENCSELTNLNLSNWNTSSVTNMNEMFYNCPNLETIFASESFKTSNVSNSTNMFTNSTEIEWWQWTTYSSSHVNKEYARIDCGPSKPGYFSRKDGDYSSCIEGTFHNTTADDSIKFDILWTTAWIDSNPEFGCIKNWQFIPAWGWYNDLFTNHCTFTNTNTVAFEIFRSNQDWAPDDYNEWYNKYTVTKENMLWYDGSFITKVGLWYTDKAGTNKNEKIYYIYATATENQKAINYYNSLKDENWIIDGNISRSPIPWVTPYWAYIRITAPDGTYKQYALKMDDDYHLYWNLNGFDSYYTLYPYPSHVINSIDYYWPVNRTIETRNNKFGSINFWGTGSWKFYAILHTNSALPDIAFPYELYQTYHNKTNSIWTPMSYYKLTQTNNNTY